MAQVRFLIAMGLGCTRRVPVSTAMACSPHQSRFYPPDCWP